MINLLIRLHLLQLLRFNSAVLPEYIPLWCKEVFIQRYRNMRKLILDNFLYHRIMAPTQIYYNFVPKTVLKLFLSTIDLLPFFVNWLLQRNFLQISKRRSQIVYVMHQMVFIITAVEEVGHVLAVHLFDPGAHIFLVSGSVAFLNRVVFWRDSFNRFFSGSRDSGHFLIYNLNQDRLL